MVYFRHSSDMHEYIHTHTGNEMALSPQERRMGWKISTQGVKGKAGRERRRDGGCLNMQPLWADGQ